MKRRKFLQTGVMLALAGRAAAQSQINPIKIIPVDKLSKVWDDAEFAFQGQACVLVRVPAPEKANPRVFEDTKRYFVAYSRFCTHNGCAVQLPNGLQRLECGCHGSSFSAADGSVIDGPATEALRAVKLEVIAGDLCAVGWL